MRWLATYTMRGRIPAMLVAAVSAILSLMLPLLSLLSYISGAAIALVTLRLGVRAGLEVIAGSAVAVGLFTAVVSNNPFFGLGFVFVLWLPVLALAVNLRRTANQGRMVLLAALFGITLIIGFHVATQDPAAWWNAMLVEAMQVAGTQTGAISMDMALLEEVSGLMTGVMAALLCLTLILSVLLGRWWQAILYNPGGFRSEFQTLRLGLRSSIGAVALMLISMLGEGGASSIASDILLLGVALFALQGVAIVHSLVAKKGAGIGWLIGMYVLVLLPVTMTQTILTLAVAGFIDNGFDFRAKV